MIMYLKIIGCASNIVPIILLYNKCTCVSNIFFHLMLYVVVILVSFYFVYRYYKKNAGPPFRTQ
jgi:hypothetical protein